MRYTEMWSFETANLRVVWDITPDEDVDTSFDETGETQAKLDSGEWQAFMSRMRVLHKGTGAELGCEYLGGSIYADPAEFRDHIGARGKYGSYFKDMVGTACEEARESLRKLQTVRVRT